MNRAYRRSKLKEQRQKYKEDRMLRKMCNDLSLMIFAVMVKGVIQNDIFKCY